MAAGAQSFKLVYFNFRGRAEITRMLFSLAKQPFVDHRIELSEWPALKPQTLFQKLPYLEVTDEVTKEKTILAQSISISRYVANKFNMAGKTDLEKAKCDMIIDQIGDALNALTNIYMNNMSDEGKLMTALKDAGKETFPNLLKGVEGMLASNPHKEGFLVGSSLTYADLHMIIFYDSLRDEKQVVLEKLPLLKKHDEMIRSIPDVAEHIKRNAHVRVSIKW